MKSFVFNLFAKEFRPEGQDLKSSFKFNQDAPEFIPNEDMKAKGHSLNLFAKVFQPRSKNVACSFKFNQNAPEFVPKETTPVKGQKLNLLAKEFKPTINLNAIEMSGKSQQMEKNANCLSHLLSFPSIPLQSASQIKSGLPRNCESAGESDCFSDKELVWEDSCLAISKSYQKVPIYSGIECNRMEFCGLLNRRPDAYWNALIQCLYYQEHVYQAVLGHSCDSKQCLVCELSFLFQELDSKQGEKLIEAKNFSSALHNDTEAIARGLVFPESFSDMLPNDLCRVIQTWNRFILEQITKENGEKRFNDFTRIYSSETVTVTTCTNCESCIRVQCGTQFGCDLVYPKSTVKMSFEDVLCSSLSTKKGVKFCQCSHCGRYQPANQTSFVQSLPSSLIVNTGLDNDANKAFWQCQSLYLINEAIGVGHHMCDGQMEEDDEVWRHSRDLEISWIPESLTIHRLASGEFKGGALKDKEEPIKSVVYELQSVCFAVLDPFTGKAENVVAAIKVGPNNSLRCVLPESRWYLFNDITINPVDSLEATWIDMNFKVPCSLVYRRVNKV